MHMDGKPLLAYNIWINLPIPVRVELERLFSIPKSGEVVVRSMGVIDGNIGSTIQSDGHTAADLYAITVEKMQELLDSNSTDFYDLFNQVVLVVEGKEEILESPTEDANKPIKKRGRPKKDDKTTEPQN